MSKNEISTQKEEKFKIDIDTIILSTLNKILEKSSLMNYEVNVLDFGCKHLKTIKNIEKLNKNLNFHIFDPSKIYSEILKKYLNIRVFSSNSDLTNFTKKYDLIYISNIYKEKTSNSPQILKIRSLLKTDGNFIFCIKNNKYKIFDLIKRKNHKKTQYFSIKEVTKNINKIGFNIKNITPSGNKLMGIHECYIFVCTPGISH